MNANKKEIIPNSFLTSRLVLAALTAAHDEFILALLNTPGWLRFIGDRHVRSLSESADYIRRINDNPKVRYWVVSLKTKGTPIGIITLIQRDYLDFPDIGFAFLPAFHSCGHAYEAAAEVTAHLTAQPDFSQLLATTVPANAASIKLLEKLRFVFDKEIIVAGEMLLVYALKQV